MVRSARKRRLRVEPTDDWQELLPLFWWPEQLEYERLHQPVLFGGSVAERAEQTGVSERTLQRRIQSFETEGMEGLFQAETAKRRRLPPNIRRLIVDLEAEYPPFNLNEIANVVGACFGRRLDVRSVRRVLEEEALPLKIGRNYPRYHEMEGPGERRAAIVELRVDGWSAKAIAGYLGVHRSTVYRTLERFKEEGTAGLKDRPHGRPAGVRKVDLRAIEEVRKLAKNPQIGAFRVHAALKQKGFDLSRTTCGRVLAQVREIYGYEGHRSGVGAKKEMPFASFYAPRVLDRRRPLPRPSRREPARGRHGLLHHDSGELLQSSARKRRHDQTGSRCFPVRALPSRRTLRLPRGARHRLRLHLPR